MSGLDFAIRLIYGLLRLGVVSGITVIANTTLRDFTADIGTAFMMIIYRLFGGVMDFVTGMFAGVFGNTVRVKQPARPAQAA